ncbi:MAG: DUF1669 domain-containing protein [Spirochaetes bacterium]|nr:DUF1669 domain-containing protein [Spirochaetota bacterium]MBN2772291.1 DUF1669 domain-containing protein [Spirochaetota bacterium]
MKFVRILLFWAVFCSCAIPEPWVPEKTSAGIVCEVSFDPYVSEQLVVELIKNSEKTVEMALYGFSNEKIADELVNASKRGVVVRCVTDYDSQNEEGWKILFDAIKQGERGLDVRLVNLNGIMHNKYIIVDGKNVVTGSTNFTSGMFKHFNNLVVFDSQSMALDFVKDFDVLYAGFSGPDKGCSLDLNSDNNGFNRLYGDGVRWSEKNHVVDDLSVAVYFTPYRAIFPSYLADSPRTFSFFDYDIGTESCASYANAMNTVFALIELAKHKIYILSFAFTDKVMMDLLADATERGVEVNVCSDYSQFRSSYSHSGKSVEALAEKINSFKLCRKDDGGLLHHKVILIDGDIVVLGSLNFSSNAVNSNDENFLIIKNAESLYGLFLAEAGRVEKYCREIEAADAL